MRRRTACTNPFLAQKSALSAGFCAENGFLLEAPDGPNCRSAAVHLAACSHGCGAPMELAMVARGSRHRDRILA